MPCLVATDDAFDQRQQIALHAFAGDIAAAALFGARADLVDLVEEDDAVVLDRLDRLAHDGVIVEQLVGFFGDQRIMRGGHGHAARRGAAAHLAEDVAEIEHAHLRARHAGNLEGRRPAAFAHLQFDFLVVEFAVAQLLAEAFARGLSGIGADQRVENAVLGIGFGARFDILALLRAHLGDADFQKIAHDLLDVAADIADFGELGRFDLEERRLRELGEPARDLGLADAGRPDHQDVLGQHLFAQLRSKLLAAPAVPQRNGDGALGVVLADDVAVEFGNDFAGREEGTHQMVRLSMTTFSLV